jgi:hypothetical protein
MVHLEIRLADVFNRLYQSHAPDERWEDVMREIARDVAFVLYPDDSQRRAGFLDDANMSGLFTAEAREQLGAKIGCG